ncbi:MAG: TonB-dependent receptor [Steroidobacteraceae bacterium]
MRATEKRFRWSGGFYYYNTKSKNGLDGVIATKSLPADFYTFCLSCRSAALFGGPANLTVDPAVGAGDATFGPWFASPIGDAVFDTSVTSDIKAPSVFATVEYDFTDAFTTRLEARYTDEKRSFDNLRANRSGSKSFGIKNYRASADYKPAPNTTIYGSYAHAEKSGSVSAATVQFATDPAPQPNVGILTSFDPEKNDAIELGIKTELLDRRVYLDFDVYFNKWKEIVIPQIQAEVVDPRGGGLRQLRLPTAFNVNAGDAEIKGAEFSVQARLTDRVDGSFGVSYNDAKYTDAKIDSFKNLPSFSPEGDVAGNEMLRASPWQLAASLGYRAPVRDSVDWYVRGDLSYRDKQFADATNQAILPDQTKLNMQLGLSGDKWTVELWGRNLTNEDSPSAAYRDVYFTNVLPDGTFYRTPAGVTPAGSGGKSTFFPWRYSVSYPTLREYGITARYRF